MRRRHFLQIFTAAAVFGLSSARALAKAGDGSLKRSAAFWQDKVSSESWRVLFEEQTEQAGTSKLYHENRPGTFVCAACYQPLFKTAQKFESGTGWPSFFDVLPGAVGKKEDRSLFFMLRTEYHCSRCGGHQGHVFDDGPKPSGLRYCNNGVALEFVPGTDKLPALRG